LTVNKAETYTKGEKGMKKGKHLASHHVADVDKNTELLGRYLEAKCNQGKDCDYCNIVLKCIKLWDNIAQYLTPDRLIGQRKAILSKLLKEKVLSDTKNDVVYVWEPYSTRKDMGRVVAIAAK
jgi:hypothetical protein